MKSYKKISLRFKWFT